MSEIAQRSGLLWIPEDPIDLLAVSIDGNCSEEEFQGMMQINQAARDWLTGKIPTDIYLDKLEYHGLNEPYELLDEFSDHIDLIYSHG